MSHIMDQDGDKMNLFGGVTKIFNNNYVFNEYFRLY